MLLPEGCEHLRGEVVAPRVHLHQKVGVDSSHPVGHLQPQKQLLTSQSASVGLLVEISAHLRLADRPTVELLVFVSCDVLLGDHLAAPWERKGEKRKGEKRLRP